MSGKGYIRKNIYIPDYKKEKVLDVIEDLKNYHCCSIGQVVTDSLIEKHQRDILFPEKNKIKGEI